MNPQNQEKRNQENRKEERVCTKLPVDLGNTTGLTRDVSASGMFFETDASFALGNEISLTVEFDTPSGKMALRCYGNIVRVDLRNKRVGVAVKIIESTMEPVRQCEQQTVG